MAEDLETFVVHNETDARAYVLAMARAWHSFVQKACSTGAMLCVFLMASLKH